MDTTHKMRRPSWRDRLAAYADAHPYAVAIVTPSVPALVLLALLVPSAAYDLGVSVRAAAVMVTVTALVVVAFSGIAAMLVADVATTLAAHRTASAWRVRHDEMRANRDAWRRDATLWAHAAEMLGDEGAAEWRDDLARTRAEQ
jgi:Trk-type K+ transport system membrane component